MDEYEENTADIPEEPEENTKEKRIKKALTEKQKISNMNNLKRALQIKKDNAEIKQFEIQQEKERKEKERLEKLEHVRLLKASKNVKPQPELAAAAPAVPEEVPEVELRGPKQKKPPRIVEKVVYETESESSDEEIIERVVIKKKPREKSKQTLISETSQEQLKKRLLEERRQRVMMDLFDC